MAGLALFFSSGECHMATVSSPRRLHGPGSEPTAIRGANRHPYSSKYVDEFKTSREERNLKRVRRGVADDDLEEGGPYDVDLVAFRPASENGEENKRRWSGGNMAVWGKRRLPSDEGDTYDITDGEKRKWSGGNMAVWGKRKWSSGNMAVWGKRGIRGKNIAVVGVDTDTPVLAVEAEKRKWGGGNMAVWG